MRYELSKRSLSKLEGVDDKLVRVVKRAIELTKVDFAVIEGLRLEDRQKELYATGASQTMNSKHLTGEAVDLGAWVGNISWNLVYYYDIAEAMREAALKENIALRWGGAWNIPDIRFWRDTMQEAVDHYVDERRIVKQRAFIDAPHFELVTK